MKLKTSEPLFTLWWSKTLSV